LYGGRVKAKQAIHAGLSQGVDKRKNGCSQDIILIGYNNNEIIIPL
jgi:hypothetical protein